LTLLFSSGANARPVRLGSKPLALLAYLALEGREQSREQLAALLWGDSPPDQARASLRQAIRQLRRVLGEALDVQRSYIALGPSVACDVTEFLSEVDRDPESAAGFPIPRFLEGFAVRRAPAFDEWSDFTRRRLLRSYHDALRAAAQNAMASSHWRHAASWADRWLSSDTLSDEAVWLACKAFYMAGDRGEVLGRYERHRTQLASETGAEPSAALQELARRIAREETPASLSYRTGAEDTRLFPEPVIEPALTGREAEWRTLTQVWQEVTGGESRVVLIEGEAGVGKSRLAEELVHWVMAEGATVLRGRGYDPEGVPFTPLIEGLRSALDAPGLVSAAPEWISEVSRVVPELRERFPDLPDPSVPGDTDRRWRLFEGFGQVILGLASEKPTVVFVDDLQLCDAECCALFHYLTRRFEHDPVLLLATCTLGETGRAAPPARLCRAIRTEQQTTVLIPKAISQEQVWRMIREVGNITAPEGGRRFAAQIHAVTDGNPFHVVELLKSLFAKGVIAVDPETQEWVALPDATSASVQELPMPRTVWDAIADRTSRLPYELRDLLATVAVSARGTSTELLSHMHGISRLRAAALADALVERRLLGEDDGMYRCAHPVIQDVIRAGLTPARQRALHREIAVILAELALESDQPHAEDIARHAERGGDHELAHRYALQASDTALRRTAYQEALSWLDFAAGVAADGPQAEEVNLRTARVLELAGWSEAPPMVRRAGTPARGLERRDLDLKTDGQTDRWERGKAVERSPSTERPPPYRLSV